jgi:hypothetical protein
MSVLKRGLEHAPTGVAAAYCTSSSRHATFLCQDACQHSLDSFQNELPAQLNALPKKTENVVCSRASMWSTRNAALQLPQCL